MNRVLFLVTLAGLIVTCAGVNVLAQDDQSVMPPMRPVETWTCSLREGKRPDDLAAVNKEWIAWMDEQGGKDCVAWFTTPSGHVAG